MPGMTKGSKHTKDARTKMRKDWEDRRINLECKKRIKEDPEALEEWIIKKARQLHDELWKTLSCAKGCSVQERFQNFIRQLMKEISPKKLEITEKDIQGWADEIRERITIHEDWSYLADGMKEMVIEELGIKVKK